MKLAAIKLRGGERSAEKRVSHVIDHVKKRVKKCGALVCVNPKSYQSVIGCPSNQCSYYAELCKIIPAKLGEFLPIFPKMADGQEEAGLSSLAALRRENSNMQESFYTSLYFL